MALFLSRAGLHMTNVSYKGAAPAFSDVIAGHVPTMFALFPDVLPHATNGAIRLLAVSSAKRLPQALDIPTISESGFPGYNTATWSGLMAPAGTAKDTVDRIAAAVEQAIKDSEIAERLIRTGIEPLGGGPSELAAMIAAEIPMWGEAAKIAGISLK
jgi:tripartite-type tricarboxylate transporter receptor subunit TctC